MPTQLFVNLPVKDLNKTVAFFTQLGFKFNAQFTNENATCMIVNESAYFMLLVEPFFKSFIKKEIADAFTTTEVINCLSADSKEAVNDLIEKAVAAGATIYSEPQDQGFMYQHSFQDINGHLWEVVWMDPAAMQ